ncbi:kinesin light chain [Cenococcum geophilum]
MMRRLRREEYTVGWVCALPVELAASQEMLDEEHEDLEQNENDNNLYALGQVGGHNIVLACLPAGQTGIGSAAVVATQLKATFKWIRFGLMVGIGGGVPSKEDIRLGDVVVSQPYQGHGGVIQYDLGKTTPNRFERTGFLNSPPQILLSAVARMRANHLRRRSKLSEHVSKIQGLSEFIRDNAGPDVLYEASYEHVGGHSCEACSAGQVVNRQPRKNNKIMIHHGTIASGNQVMRDGTTRDEVSRDFGGVLCFEMEAAGLMNSFPCLVVRGICDYADSHKNKRWQAYASVAAAACAKELLSVIPPADVAGTRTVEETIRATSERALPPSYNIPFPRNRRFVGRSTVLKELTQKLLMDKECQRVALVGLGGIGKTQVALEFAYTYSIFWSMEQACGDIARIHDKEDIKELVRQYLNNEAAGQWLLIVDNADNMELLFGTGQSKGIADYLPQSENGLIIFTTRHQEAAVSLADSDIIELEEMNREEAVSFLEKSLVRKHLLGNGTTTTELLDELTYLPLAIAQAVAYLNTNKISILEYLRLLRNTEQDIISLMSQGFRDNTRYKKSENAVARTWLVSFDQIRDHDRVAADLLSFMSCIEPKAIPHSILPIVQPEERMVRAIGTLCAYSFVVRRGDEDIYDIHRLVHLATRIWIEKHGIAAETMEKAIRHVSKVFPSAEYTNRAVWREYLTHALRLLRVELDEDVKKRYTLCLKVGECLLEDGRIREAVAWFEESYQWRKNNLAEEHPSRLASQHKLASAYQADGQVKKAVELLEHIVAVDAKMLAEEHPHRLDSQHELTMAYQADGQVKKAVELLEYIVAIDAKVLAEEHPSRLASQHELASAYQADGQVKKAVELLEHVVAVQTKVLAEEHPSRLTSQHELARTYQADGQVKKAVELLEHVVAVQTKVLAEEHPSQLTSQHGLASAYRVDGQIKKAVGLLEHVVAVQKKVLAEEHPSQLASQHELVSAYRADGQIKKAVELLEHVVAVQKKTDR